MAVCRSMQREHQNVSPEKIKHKKNDNSYDPDPKLEQNEKVQTTNLDIEVITDGIQNELNLILMGLRKHSDCGARISGPCYGPTQPGKHEHYSTIFCFWYNQSHTFWGIVVRQHYVDTTTWAYHGLCIFVRHFSNWVTEWARGINHNLCVCFKHFPWQVWFMSLSHQFKLCYTYKKEAN